MGGSGQGAPDREDRRRAAERLLLANPEQSDRSIADACGTSSKVVATTRRRLLDRLPQPEARVGRDGRVRPLDAGAGRKRAAELITERPGASLREIAQAAGVSPGTVRDVRDRLRDGRSPVSDEARTRPRRAQAPKPSRTAPPTRPKAVTQADAAGVDEWSDWLAARAVEPGSCTALVDAVPMSRVYVVAELARRVAKNWEGLAEALERRGTP